MARKKQLDLPDPAAEENQTRFHGLIEGHPLDAASALHRAMNVVCGKDKWKGFSWLEVTPWGAKVWHHPTEVRVPTGVTTYESITWGRLVAPGLFDGYLSQNIEHKRKRPILAVEGKVSKESMPFVQKVIDRATQFVREASIFKGKAVHLLGQDSDYDPHGQPILDLFGTLPKFLDLSTVKEDQLRYPAHTMKLVRKALFTPVIKSLGCRQGSVPLKRGVMLAGTYGVGKTLCAFVTAKLAVENGWTFLYLDDVNTLERGVDFALAYPPALLYAEDVDQIEGIHERDQHGNRIINALDSIESKNSEILTVLTTNHIDQITPALLRPGRVDAIINIPVPDRPTIDGLIRMYAGVYLYPDIDLSYVTQKLAGQIPAVIRETVERAKLEVLTYGELLTGCLTDQLLLSEAEDMVAHAKQVAGIKEPAKLSKREKAAHILSNAHAPSGSEKAAVGDW
jgi:transitional endoplasmic reticulum ATPase